jgi:hypothetical protein
MGMPTTENLKAIIQMNLIWNNIVTAEEINLMARVFREDIRAMKRKTTKSHLTPVISNIIKIPDKVIQVQQDVILSMDGITVNSMKLLTTILCKIYVSNTNAKEYIKCLDKVTMLDKRRNSNIKQIYCNNKFQKAMDNNSSK